MPSAAVEAAFRSRLESSWTTSPIVGSNGITSPPSGVDAFLVLQYPVVNGDKPVLHGKFFEEGAARLVLNVSKGIWRTDGLAWADTLASLFREYRPGGGFETFVPSGPRVNDSIDDGSWVELTVIVPYRFQFNG